MHFLSFAYKGSQENQWDGAKWDMQIDDKPIAFVWVLDSWRRMLVAGTREMVVEMEKDGQISKTIRKWN